LLFRRTPNSQKKVTNLKTGKGAPQLQIIPGGKGYRYVNPRQQTDELSTRKLNIYIKLLVNLIINITKFGKLNKWKTI
jgi:hypothetical protein